MGEGGKGGKLINVLFWALAQNYVYKFSSRKNNIESSRLVDLVVDKAFWTKIDQTEPKECMIMETIHRIRLARILLRVSLV